MSKQPLVSIVIICHNYGNYLREAVISVLSQTYHNTEILIINDGSIDITDTVVKDLMHEFPRIRYYKQPNRGVIYSRNKAIKESSGEFIIQLDADDVLDIDYVEKTTVLAQKMGADIVYTDFKRFGEYTDVSNFPDYNFEILKNSNYMHISSLVRRQAIGGVIFDKHLDKLSHEDWDFFQTLCAKGAKAVKCNTTYLRYRIHGNGRNNLLQGNQQAKEYIDTYKYIVDKKIRQGHNKQFSYLAINTFSDLYNQLYQECQLKEGANNELQDRAKMLERQLDILSINYENISNSKSYKLGRIILWPFRLVKKLTDH